MKYLILSALASLAIAADPPSISISTLFVPVHQLIRLGAPIPEGMGNQFMVTVSSRNLSSRLDVSLAINGRSVPTRCTDPSVKDGRLTRSCLSDIGHAIGTDVTIGVND